jgi:hypothetical protein
MYIIFVCFTSKTLKWLLLLLYTHPHPSFLGNVNIGEAELIFPLLFFFFFNFFNIAPLTCAFELTSSNSYFNSYCKHLSLRIVHFQNTLKILIIYCVDPTTTRLIHFSRENWWRSMNVDLCVYTVDYQDFQGILKVYYT